MANAVKDKLLTSLTRAKQYTGEKLGRADKTEFEASFDALLNRIDNTKAQTERLLKLTSSYLEPNPNRRLEQLVSTKLRRKHKERMPEVEALGHAMVETGEELGDSSVYGRGLVQAGKAQVELGDRWINFSASVTSKFMDPLQDFIGNDLKAVATERKALNAARLDLDAAKSKVRKPGQTQDKIDLAEEEIRSKQAIFDRQYEITKLLLERLQKSTEEHVRQLAGFIDAQYEFFAAAAELTANVSRELRRTAGMEPPSYNSPIPTATTPSSAATNTLSPTSPPPAAAVPAAAPTAAPASASTPAATVTATATSSSSSGTVTARVLCNFDAEDSTELSLVADEAVLVRKDAAGLPKGWVMAEREGKSGKVPRDYLEFEE